MNGKGISAELQNFYRRWLRFYLGFCHKYEHAPKNADSLPHFTNKLKEKNQVKQLQK